MRGVIKLLENLRQAFVVFVVHILVYLKLNDFVLMLKDYLSSGIKHKEKDKKNIK